MHEIVRNQRLEPNVQKNKKHVKQKPRRRIGRKLLIAFLIVTVGEWIFFVHYNQLLDAASSHAARTSASYNQQQKTQQKRMQSNLLALEKQHSGVMESLNQQYAAYVNSNNSLIVKNLVSNQTTFNQPLAYPTKYIRWIRNSEIFLGEDEGNGNLILATINIDTGNARIIKTFSGLTPNSNFSKITYSPYTNDTYVLITNSSSSVVYHFDTNGNMYYTHFGGRFIKNISVSQTGDVLYFEELSGGVFKVGYLLQSPHLQSWSVHIIQQNAGLIGCDQNTFYYGTINAQGLVTDVYQFTLKTGQSKFIAHLQQPYIAHDLKISPTGKITYIPETTSNG